MGDEQRRVMEFIRTVNRVGYYPTGPEINEWRKTPDPIPKRRGKLVTPAVPGTPDRRVRRKGTGPSPLLEALARQNALFHNPMQQFIDANQRKFDQIFGSLSGPNSPAVRGALDALRMAGLGAAEYDVIPGEPGAPAVYGPDRPPEKFLAHLRRLRWIDRSKRGRYSVTQLGQAVLDGDMLDEDARENSSVIVLAKDNELAYPTVIGKISSWEDAMVIDGYLTPEALKDLLDHTNATRFLVNHPYKPEMRAVLSLAFKSAGPNDDGTRRELRRAVFHDRYLIGSQMVYGLTGSLNGIGRTSSALIFEMPDTPAQAVREEMDELWDSAEHLAYGLDADSYEDDDSDDLDAKVIYEEDDGRFTHEGCSVRHKKHSAAENCTNKREAATPDGE